MEKKLLLTGATGFLGFNICRYAPPGWRIFGLTRWKTGRVPRAHLLQTDITRLSELKQVFRQVRPDAVIHAAAVSSSNMCQTNKAEAHRVNVDASAAIAGLCADYGARCLFTSSDMVFDGESAPYGEEDSVAPINVYGEQKVLAEESMRRRLDGTIICRLALMFGEPGSSTGSFIQPMVQAIRNNRELPLFVDEFRTPLSAKTAVHGLFAALEHPGMTLHLGGAERVSRFELGLILVEALGARSASLKPCKRADLDLPAPRPRDLSLKIDRARGLGLEPLPLEAELKALFAAKDETK